MMMKRRRRKKKRRRKRKRKRRKVGPSFTNSFYDKTDRPNSAAPAAKKRKIGPETPTTADASVDTRVKGTKATVTDPNTYQAEKGVVLDNDEEENGEDGAEGEDEEEEEDGEEDGEEEEDEEDEGEDDEPAVKTRAVKGGEGKAAAAEAEEDFDDED
jgi:hypothetical protein